MAMPGPFEWLILIGVALVVAGSVWQSRVGRRQRQARGFEVKPSAGSETSAGREEGT